MNKNDVAKVVKRIAIGGIVYLTADLCYQMGKGVMLRKQMKYKLDPKEVYDLLSDDGLTKMEAIRCKIIKHFADLEEDRG